MHTVEEAETAVHMFGGYVSVLRNFLECNAVLNYAYFQFDCL